MYELLRSLKVISLMTLLLGIAYPLVMTLLSQVFFYHQANGSLLYRDKKIIGSELIGQKFSNDKYFWGRPSAVDYQTLPGGASNLSVISPKLKAQVEEKKSTIQKAHGLNKEDIVPSELLFASASGVDPHISVDTAYFQIPRILKARPHITEEKIRELIDSQTDRSIGSILSPEFVNVLKLNLALDQLQ